MPSLKRTGSTTNPAKMNHDQSPPGPSDRAAPLTVRPQTEALLALAQGVLDADAAGHGDALARFMAAYRVWILDARGMADDQPQWAERNQILLHLMVSGSTLREAIAIKARFVHPVWGAGSRLGIASYGDSLELHYDEAVDDSADSLISTMWVLSITACQLEFLAGRKLASLEATLRHDRGLTPKLARFFLPCRTTHGASRSAIRLSGVELDSPVTATVAQIPEFLHNLMQLSVDPGTRSAAITNVSNLLMREITRNRTPDATMPMIAASLGLSPATLRRRLEAEGASFKQIKADILDRLAKMWLRETNMPLEQVADRLGYSDAFALRRAFRRRNGMPPSVFRTQTAAW